MSTKRMIHDRFFDSLDTAEWSIQQRYLVLGMIAHADDQGRLLADPRVLKKDIVPYDAITPADIQADLEHVAEHGDTVILYEVDSRQYVQFSNWWEYQSLQWAKPSEYPAPEGWDDRIRQLQYQPKRWVMTVNWPGTEDCTEPTPSPKANGGPPTPTPKANETGGAKGNEGGNALPNRLPDESGNFIFKPYSSDSDSKPRARARKQKPKTRTSAMPTPADMRVQAILDVCDLDASVSVHVGQAEWAASQLDSYKAEDIWDRYGRPDGDAPPHWNWYTDDFRGRKGEPPTPKWVVENISKVASREKGANGASDRGEGAYNRLLKAMHDNDYRSLPKDIVSVLRRMNKGTSDLRSLQEREMPFFRQAFIEAYNATN